MEAILLLTEGGGWRVEGGGGREGEKGERRGEGGGGEKLRVRCCFKAEMPGLGGQWVGLFTPCREHVYFFRALPLDRARTNL